MRVTGLSAKTNYDVQLDYNAPKELTETVGTPVFRLELYRPQNPQTPATPQAGEESLNADEN